MINLKDAVLKTINDKSDDMSSDFIKTGLERLDELTGGGIRRGGICIIGARPAFGKTALALQISQNLSREHKGTVVYWNLEGNAHELGLKMNITEKSINIKEINKNKLKPEFINGLKDYISESIELNFFCEDSISTIDKFIEKCRELKKDKTIDLIVIDYIQLISNEKKIDKNKFYRRCLEKLSKFSKESNCAILVLTQLPRQIEERSNKRPNLLDLESNPELRELSDLVMFIYRDDMYYPNSDEKGYAEIIVEKNKNSDRGMAKFKFNHTYYKYGPLL